MRKSLLALAAIVLVIPALARAQAAPFWPAGKRAAIVLTYDDALQSQLDVALPQLKAAQLTGTFFLKADNLTPKNLPEWRQAAADGQELGNHTVNHPCPNAMLPGRDYYATERHDTRTIVTEIGVMNTLLFAIDGHGGDRTLSYPCSQTLVGGTDYRSALRASGLIRYARNGGDPYTSVVTDFAALDPLNVPSYGPIDHPGGGELIRYVERVRAAGGLGVLQFHGVGGDYLEVSGEAHQQLLAYLKAHPDIWVATFREVMDYVAAHR
jgi:peptidoglycan/xylan/chitin deacetylase (PgdA/CDA1 family)